MMDTHIVAMWEACKSKLLQSFKSEPPDDYADVFLRLVQHLHAAGESSQEENVPDPTRITTIDFGSYQGATLFVVADCGYTPGVVWVCRVHYGSCTHCDTMASIKYSLDGRPDEQAAEYLTLALHMVQGMKRNTF
jgi:hypothetical protein